MAATARDEVISAISGQGVMAPPAENDVIALVTGQIVVTACSDQDLVFDLHRRLQREAGDNRVVIRREIGKVGVDVNDVDLSAVQQVVGHKDVVQGLRVAIEDEGIGFVPVQLVDQVGQNLLITDARQIFGQFIGEVEGVQIAQNRDIRVGVIGQQFVHDLVDGLGLLLAHRFGALVKRLRPAIDRVGPGP